MQGKVCIVTGANSGIGRATAQELARLGATLILACRDKKRGEEAQKAIQIASNNPQVDLMLLDLSDQRSVREMAANFRQKYSRLDVLINNAGVYKNSRSLTRDGLETMFATNHLGHFLLTNLLLDMLKASAPSRIINITAPSTTQLDFDDLQGERKFGAFSAFGASKMCNLLFTYELARRVAGTGVSVNAAHPGLVKSNILSEAAGPIRWLTSLISTTPEKAAQNIVYLASSAEVEDESGKFFKARKVSQSAPYSKDEQVQQRLWQLSLKLAGLE